MTVSIPKMPVVRKYRKETTEISGCLKYMIFGFNVLFWLLGLGILTIGVWAWSEKDIFNNLGRVANIALDPAFVLICIGTVTFVIGFTGCVGALRENTCLLATYAIFLSVLLLCEMTAGILGFIFKDWIKSQATIGFQTFIIHYREDPDQQNMIDWIQEDWLQCCGIEGPKDWDRNNYFNCSSKDVGSREACGVPFSCCKRKPKEIIKNKQCGYDVRKPGFVLSAARSTKRSTSSPTTKTVSNIDSLHNEIAVLTISTSASSSAYSTANAANSNLFFSIDMRRTLFFSLANNRSCETCTTMVSSKRTSAETCFFDRRSLSAVIVFVRPPSVVYPSKTTIALEPNRSCTYC